MTDNSGQEEFPEEKTRICPSCRMRISVLATRCLHCGESVGRPKDETRELSTQDLGGETIYHRAPSGSVIDALEAFREEEDASAQAGPDNHFSSPSGVGWGRRAVDTTPTDRGR